MLEYSLVSTPTAEKILKGKLDYLVNSKAYLRYVESKFDTKVMWVLSCCGNNPIFLLPICRYENGGKKILGTFPRTLGCGYQLEKCTVEYDKIGEYLTGLPDWDIVQLRVWGRGGKLPSPGLVQLPESHYVMELDSSWKTEELMGLFKNRGRKIRKALKAGNKIRLGDDINEFYPLYLQTISRLGSKPKPKEYFVELKRGLRRNFVIIGCYKNKKLVAANVCYFNSNYMVMLFNVSEQACWKEYVNDLIYFGMIEEAWKRKVKYLDYGPTMDADYSHVKIKTDYLGKPWPINEYCRFRDKRDLVKYRIHLIMMSGSLIYRRLRMKYGK